MLPLMLHHANEHKKLHSCPAVWPVFPCIGFYTPSTSLGNFGNSCPNPNRSSTTQQTTHTARLPTWWETGPPSTFRSSGNEIFKHSSASPRTRCAHGEWCAPAALSHLCVSLSRASAPLRWWSSSRSRSKPSFQEFCLGFPVLSVFFHSFFVYISNTRRARCWWHISCIPLPSRLYFSLSSALSWFLVFFFS